MSLLANTSNNEVHFVLQGSNQTAYYNQLKRVLPPELYQLFAKPTARTQEVTSWVTELPAPVKASDIKKYSDLNQEDKDWVADYIDQKKSEIVEILKNEPFFENDIEKLFFIPSNRQILEDIKVIDLPGGREIVLTRWGSIPEDNEGEIKRFNTPIPPPPPGRKRVTIKVTYSHGEVAPGKDFYFKYLSTEKPFEKRCRTNKKGLSDRGLFRPNTQFEVYDKKDDEVVYVHDFTVSDQEIYEVQFPLFTTGKAKVVNQKRKVLLDHNIIIVEDGKERAFNTGKTGVVSIDQLVVGQEIEISSQEKPEFKQRYKVAKSGNDFILEIYEPVFVDATLRVENQHGELIPDVDLYVRHQGEEASRNSGDSGIINFTSLEAGKAIVVKSASQPANSQTYTLEEGSSNEFVFKIDMAEPESISVKLIGYDGNPMPDIPIDFTYQKGPQHIVTNQEGIYLFNAGTFTDKEKVKTLIHLPKEGKKKEKKVKKKFKFKKEQTEYIIRLRRRRFLWWLLLLLLPLLLLIRCEKEVCVKAINAENQKGVAQADVAFEYHQEFIYDQGKFFTDSIHSLRQTTDGSGVACFGPLKYSVYSWIFKHQRKALTWAISGCFASDTLEPVFHNIGNRDTITLLLKPLFIPLDFMVVDSVDQEPLPDAKVVVESEYLGEIYIDSARSEADGRVVFNRLPKCGIVKEIRASLEGYYPDSIVSVRVDSLENGTLDDDRKLELVPIYEKLVFYVEDCKTKRRLPDAKVKIDIDYEGGNKSTTKRTNVNGVGKGEYDKAHTIANVKMEGRYPGYEKGNLPKHKVEEFIKLKPEDRTICLKPIPDPVIFKNVDSLTNAPLANVKNIVKKENNGIVDVDTIPSDANGEFQIGIAPNDKITIISQYPPDYEDNDSKIVNADGEALKKSTNPRDRTIPLSPKMVKMVFRTVEDSDPTKVIPDANVAISVTAGGRRIQLPKPLPNKSDGKGEFTVEVPITSKISIVADKANAGYGTNRTKIKNKSAKLLHTEPQSERDIPLKLLPIKVKFRDVDSTGNGISGVKNRIFINGNEVSPRTSGTNGEFEVEALPNAKIKVIASNVYDTNDTKVDGTKTLKQLQGATQDARDIPLKIPPIPQACNENASGKNQGDDIEEYNLGGKKFQIEIHYQMNSIPDELIVYCGRKNKKNKTPIARTKNGKINGPVSGFGILPIDLSKCSGKWITIEVIGDPNGGQKSSTAWDYTIKCIKKVKRNKN